MQCINTHRRFLIVEQQDISNLDRFIHRTAINVRLLTIPT
jgi:hypothetical protein